jgi:hypothetical protein
MPSTIGDIICQTSSNVSTSPRTPGAAKNSQVTSCFDDVKVLRTNLTPPKGDVKESSTMLTDCAATTSSTDTICNINGMSNCDMSSTDKTLSAGSTVAMANNSELLVCSGTDDNSLSNAIAPGAKSSVISYCDTQRSTCSSTVVSSAVNINVTHSLSHTSPVFLRNAAVNPSSHNVVMCFNTADSPVSTSHASQHRTMTNAVNSSSSLSTDAKESSGATLASLQYDNDSPGCPPVIVPGDTCESECQPQATVHDLTMRVPGPVFKNLYDSRGKKGLGCGWTETMYEHFHKIWPMCSVIFTDNRLKAASCATWNTPFWKAYGRCRTGPHCIKIVMTIGEKPNSETEDVVVSVTVYGDCVHQNLLQMPDDNNNHVYLPNRRQLRGQARQQIVEDIKNSGRSSSDKYFRKLGFMADLECRSGNMTACQTTGIMRQAVYESKKRDNIHQDMVIEVNAQRESFLSAMPRQKLSGYIQTVTMFPFTVTFYCEEQIKAYITACQADGGCTVHLDATGCVTRNIDGQKMPFYYCMLLADGSLPVFDMLTSRQTAVWIQSALDSFNASVRLVNNGKMVKPSYVVTDQSLALMYACLRTFNNHSLHDYLLHCFGILTGKVSSVEIKSTTFLVNCVAHRMKCLSVALTKKEPNKNLRKTAMVLFSSLRRMNDLASAGNTFRLIYITLCSRQESEVVVTARQQLYTFATDESFALCETEIEQAQHDESNSEDASAENAQSIREQSPFTRFFNAIVAKVDSQMKLADESNPVTNSTYSPHSFSCIQGQMFLFPIWSAALQTNATRFARNVEHEKTFSQTPLCRSNAAVEAHFRSTKKDRRNGFKVVRPRQFIDAELAFVMGKLNERKLPKLNVNRLKGNTDVADTKEKWCKRRRSRQYATASTAATILAKFKQPQNASKTIELSCPTSNNELDDNDVDTALEILRRTVTNVDGLEHPGLGQYCECLSAPRFVGAVGRFVQIFHLHQHWVCATNVFSPTVNEIYWYDSIAKDFIVAEAIVQLTSMLRHCIGRNSLTIRLRCCPQQPAKSSLCGHYAIVAAIAICSGYDPTFFNYSSSHVFDVVNQGLQNGCFGILNLTNNPRKVSDIAVLHEPQRLCVCQRPMDDFTIRCSTCNNWYHSMCVDSQSANSGVWNGPCHSVAEDAVVIEIDET